jgi:hypothetical protein
VSEWTKKKQEELSHLCVLALTDNMEEGDSERYSELRDERASYETIWALDTQPFTCTEFVGHWPVGTAAVVMAYGEIDAAERLAEKLADIGLEQPITPDMMKKLSSDVVILADGNY